MKLNTTKLVDQSTALSLGRLIAARLILSGQVVYSGPETMISMRMVDTESGEVKGAFNDIFGSTVRPVILAEKLSEIILDKIEALYPLRGKISGKTRTQL